MSDVKHTVYTHIYLQGFRLGARLILLVVNSCALTGE